MGKTRPPEKAKLSKRNKKLLHDKKKKETLPPAELLAQAVALMGQGDAESALHHAAAALKKLQSQAHHDQTVLLPALSLLGEINVELGDIPSAVAYFQKAVQMDPEGALLEEQGGGAEKFLWLAQLSENGGIDSVKWFEKGADVLRNELSSRKFTPEEELERRAKLASALCGIAEIYMTDLSWDDNDAEAQCDRVMEEALQVAPDNPETLQTLASVRISQLKKEEAKQYLSRSLDLWKDLPPEDPNVPAFPTRISLARLLMEAGMEDEALEVTERLVSDYDQSVEAWYLGGYCQQLISEREQGQSDSMTELTDEVKEHLQRSRVWLKKCLELYQLLGYEDERLRDHTVELVQSIDSVLPLVEGEEEEALADDGWEDEDDEGDDDMDGPE